jgi:hypothetical protein
MTKRTEAAYRGLDPSVPAYVSSPLGFTAQRPRIVGDRLACGKIKKGATGPLQSLRQIRGTWWNTPDLDLHESAVLTVLELHADAQNECYPFVQTLAREAKVSERHTYRVLASLRSKGRLEVAKTVHGRGWHNHYRLLPANDVPPSAPGPVHCVSSSAGIPGPAAQCCAFRQLDRSGSAPLADPPPYREWTQDLNDPLSIPPPSSEPAKPSLAVTAPEEREAILSSSSPEQSDKGAELESAYPREARILRYWHTRLFPGETTPVITLDRIAHVRARLGEQFDEAKLCLAVDGAALSPWHSDAKYPNRRTVKALFGSADQVQQVVSLARAKGPPKAPPPPPKPKEPCKGVDAPASQGDALTALALILGLSNGPMIAVPTSSVESSGCTPVESSARVTPQEAPKASGYGPPE